MVKSNEITAIPCLIEVHALSGQIITPRCHDPEESRIHRVLKDNQGNLNKEAQDQFHFAIRNLDLAHSEGWSYKKRIDKSNGRTVTRSVTVNHPINWMDTEIRGKWGDLLSLIHVETQPTQFDSDEIRRKARYNISTLNKPTSAFQSQVRQHWGIENSCHWVLETAFREDHNKNFIGHASKNLGALRRIVLNLLKIGLTDTRTISRRNAAAPCST